MFPKFNNDTTNFVLKTPGLIPDYPTTLSRVQITLEWSKNTRDVVHLPSLVPYLTSVQSFLVLSLLLLKFRQ